jgi:alkanesulfonate monooxygenase SsuD/methylene tetrahydromethanopterin reductase-like flavin-dependent oxidoreductase (luciferase family)
MKFGLDVATTDEWSDIGRLTELAAEAEAAGWDGFFPWDVLLTGDGGPVADPWLTLASVALATTRLRIGAMVTPLARRLPWDVAKTVAELDQLSGGRMVLGVGLGSGDSEFRSLGLPTDLRERADVVDESLAVIDALWSDGPARSAGRHYRIEDAQMAPKPLQRPRVPIWTAAGWPRRRPLRRAVNWDGVYLMTNNQETNQRLTPDEVAQVAAFVRANRTLHGSFDIAANVSTLDDDDGGSAISGAMAAAGVTWTMELTPTTYDRHLALVRRGPPRSG